LRGPAFIAVAAVCATAAAGAAAAPAASPPSCPGADAVPTEASAARARAAVACLLDAARAERDLPALRRDARLRTAAQEFARSLAPGRALRHTGPGGSTPLKRIAAAGYPRDAGFSASETLGRGEGSYATPATRVQTWLRDAPTRRLLLSARYRDVGVGVMTRGGATTYVVELAQRTPVSPASAAGSRSPR
jgi:uncharacterized protein YkwD